MIYLKLFWTFLKVGAFTFGGGYAMIPLIQSEVLAQGWVTEERLIDFIAISESTPGPFAVNISTFIGMDIGGFWGAVCATLGVVLPSFVILLLIAAFFTNFKDKKGIRALLWGIKAAISGLILAAVFSIGKTVMVEINVFPSVPFFASAAIFLLMLFLLYKKKHPILIVVLSAVLGIAFNLIYNLF